MEYKISYFYMIRFFKPNQIPLSTALWDPKWYHKNGNDKYNYLDKNGVINGLRLDELVPKFAYDESPCPCESKRNSEDALCGFLSEYYNQLNALDFERFKTKVSALCNRCKETMGFADDPEPVFIVYETPNNPCSEREVLIRYFKEKGLLLTEFKIEGRKFQPWEKEEKKCV